MGRELKRVPLDFDWPLKTNWWGYFNPYQPTRCQACDGSGYNPETKRISDNWYNYSSESGTGWQYDLTQDEVDTLVAKGGLYGIKENPTPADVNEWAKHGLGHDSINQWICVKTRAKRLGVWGKCKWCNGEDGIFHSEEHKRLYESWRPTDPPTGEGFQIWQTTSEGSPVSPVFSTLETLCEWCETNATTFAHHRATKEEWFAMLKDDFVRHEDKETGAVFL